MNIRTCWYWIGFNITCWFPLPVAYLIADILGVAHYFFAREWRRNYTANLRVLFPEKDTRAINRIVFRAFRNLARNLADQFRIHRNDRHSMADRIETSAKDIEAFRIHRGKPLIVATGHFGHWELSASLPTSILGELNSIALSEVDLTMDGFYLRARQAIGNNTVLLANASRACMRLLKEGRPLAILTDRSYTEEGIVLDFFGRKALFPTGIAQLAMKYKAAILPYFIARTHGKHFKAYVFDLISIPTKGAKAVRVETILKQYVAILEDVILRHPENWHAFHPVWMEEVTGAKKGDIPAKLGE